MKRKSSSFISDVFAAFSKSADKIPDTEVLERAELPSVITTTRKAYTRWADHVLRMSDSCIPKQLLYGEL